VFRIGSFIPIPGIDAAVLAKLLEQQRGTIIEMFNMFSGGALSRASIFALGIMPYISASIIIQLLTVVYPALAEMKKEGSLVVVRSASTPATVLWCWRYSSRSVLLPVCRICLVCRAW
jgi:preprotein translocase subunit SecY